MSEREYICQYGNCHETDTPILITNKRALERVRFCCEEHAALYLLRQCGLAALVDRVQGEARR
jgi:hypothetical protein